MAAISARRWCAQATRWNCASTAAAATPTPSTRRETPAVERQIERAFRLALGRAPAAEEARRLAEYARAHGLPNACRVIFNLNEFTFVD